MFTATDLARRHKERVSTIIDLNLINVHRATERVSTNTDLNLIHVHRATQRVSTITDLNLINVHRATQTVSTTIDLIHVFRVTPRVSTVNNIRVNRGCPYSLFKMPADTTMETRRVGQGSVYMAIHVGLVKWDVFIDEVV